MSAFVIELNRARSGNTLSWAYVFEWPILGVYAIYMWRKLSRPDDGEATSPSPTSPADDDALTRYNRYLSEVHRGVDDTPTDE